MAEETPAPSAAVARVVGKHIEPVATIDNTTGRVTGSVLGPGDDSTVWATDHHDGRGPVPRGRLGEVHAVEVPLTDAAIRNPQATEQTVD